MRLTIVIDMDNAAFEEPGRSAEVTEILKAVVKKLSLYRADKINLRDVNGNRVGFAETTD